MGKATDGRARNGSPKLWLEAGLDAYIKHCWRDGRSLGQTVYHTKRIFGVELLPSDVQMRFARLAGDAYRLRLQQQAVNGKQSLRR
jgi:hypothetical protein